MMGAGPRARLLRALIGGPEVERSQIQMMARRIRVDSITRIVAMFSVILLLNQPSDIAAPVSVVFLLFCICLLTLGRDANRRLPAAQMRTTELQEMAESAEMARPRPQPGRAPVTRAIGAMLTTSAAGAARAGGPQPEPSHQPPGAVAQMAGSFANRTCDPY